MDIVSHKGWGANYLRPLQRTNVRNKTAFLVHYHGGEPRNSAGKAVPKEVEAIHHANGWNGLGYNFAVDQAGTIYEGYGWDGVGAQCPGFNTSGIGTYVAIGGDQKPSDAALASVRWLYDEGCRRSGNTLRKMGHRDGWATACPGPHLYSWVQAGMPGPDTTSPEEELLMALDTDAIVQKIRNAVLFDQVIGIIGRDEKMSLATAVRVVYDRVKGHDERINEIDAKVEGAIVALKAASPDPDKIAALVDKAVRDRLAKLAVIDRPDEAAPAPEVKP